MAGRLRIELIDVSCRDTEDITVPDTFYLMSVLAVSATNRSVAITSPIKIRSGETHNFPPNEQVVFDGDVKDGDTIVGGFKAFEEDAEKPWHQRPAWIAAILEGLPAFPVSNMAPLNADLLLTAAGNVLDLTAHSDRDDCLGQHILVVPAAGAWTETQAWTFKEEGVGLSTWDYTVRYRITRNVTV